MEAAKGQKRSSTENELMTHVDNISDPIVRAYIQKKKEIKLKAKREKQGIWSKVAVMDSEDEMDVEMD